MSKPNRGAAALAKLCPKPKDRVRIAFHCDVSTEAVRLWAQGSVVPNSANRRFLADFFDIAFEWWDQDMPKRAA